MTTVRDFLTDLSRLLREGETETLEFVVGLLAFTLGVQLSYNLWMGTPGSVSTVLPYWLIIIMAITLVAGGIGKVWGAITGNVWFRRFSAMSLVGVWGGIVVANFETASFFIEVFFTILALQSSWVYIRLSLLRKQREDGTS